MIRVVGSTPPNAEYLSITPETLSACSLRADEARSLSPMPERWLYPDHILWKVGDVTFKRPLRETLPDFLTDHLKYTFGKPWAEQQYAMAEDKRHVVMRWWFSVCELTNQMAGPGHNDGQWFKVEPSGDAMEFMSLADDLYRLRLAGALRPKLVNRLRHHAEFQGARYECAIAASFVRTGFEIAWQTGAGKKCEFIATHKLTGESIAIEVKSRRRPGTLNESGEPRDRTTLRADVKHLYEKAREQCPADGPCGIFIDVNLPPESASDPTRIPWEQDIKSLLDEYPESQPDTPAIETCLIFTSFGWHYTGEERAKGLRHVSTFPQYVQHRLTKMDTFVAILGAIQTYGQIPTVE